jgi:hypothetical protein
LVNWLQQFNKPRLTRLKFYHCRPYFRYFFCKIKQQFTEKRAAYFSYYSSSSFFTFGPRLHYLPSLVYAMLGISSFFGLSVNQTLAKV